jgi:hypothetical protein
LAELGGFCVGACLPAAAAARCCSGVLVLPSVRIFL